MIKKVIKKLISFTGYSVYKNGVDLVSQESMTAGLRRLNQMGISPDIVVDLGAAQGFWTEKSLTVWPNAKYELIEPLTEQLPAS